GALLGATAPIAALTFSDPPRDQARHGYATRLRTGIAYLRRHRSLRALTVMFVVTNLLDQALIAVLLPVWARDGGHSAATVGLALSAAGAAAVCSALGTAWLGTRLPRRRTYLAAVIISGPTRLIVLALGWPPEAVIAVWLLAGLGSGVFNPLLETVQIEMTPAELRGRVLTLIGALAWVGIPVGGLLGAGLLTAVGLPAALWICGLAYLAAVVHPGNRVAWEAPRAARDDRIGWRHDDHPGRAHRPPGAAALR
ncbi:MFS transporter, partial [Actinoplanes sp. NPDC024001]|uniref:MFS transporter n=1 Tax=Actinoplanes sp. NPDC024001 TaxID=3154598 RepID=UPI0033EB0CD4